MFDLLKPTLISLALPVFGLFPQNDNNGTTITENHYSRTRETIEQSQEVKVDIDSDSEEEGQNNSVTVNGETITDNTETETEQEESTTTSSNTNPLRSRLSNLRESFEFLGKDEEHEEISDSEEQHNSESVEDSENSEPTQEPAEDDASSNTSFKFSSRLRTRPSLFDRD